MGTEQATGTEARVIADIIRRQREGIAKYGCTVEENPLTLREWLQHAYEESLDLPIYLRRAIEHIDETSDEFMNIQTDTKEHLGASLPPTNGSAFRLHVRCELDRARANHKPINSAHEGYAVILEELDEFWDEVKKKRELRDGRRMYEELVQIAAMAQRTAEDVLDIPTINVRVQSAEPPSAP